MAIEIKEYTPDLIPYVREFNLRLKARGVDIAFPETNVLAWLPKVGDRKIFREPFLAIENENIVRGAYILKNQEFYVKGNLCKLGNLQLPLSEGIIDKKYNMLGMQLLIDAQKREPRLFALGIGSYEDPLTQILKALGWNLYSIPFYFKINHPFRFLKEIRFLRKSPFHQAVLNISAYSGLGWLGIKSVNLLKTSKTSFERVWYEETNTFSDWCDELWHRSKDHYSLIAVRDAYVLQILYPENNLRFIRLKIWEGSNVIGWAVVLDTPMANHKHFGAMRLGSIIDCLSLPSDAAKVVCSATKFLENRGVDLIVSNQSHVSWCTAMEKAGYLRGPSNYIFATARKLSELLSPFEKTKKYLHINRGDGDGPVHL